MNTSTKILFAVILISLVSCLSPKERYDSEGFKFSYNRFAFTELNPIDFSWKFLKEFEKEGYFVLNPKRKTLIIKNDEGDELFKIVRIEKKENGYIASTDKNNIIIISQDYNRIAIGRVNSNKFMMFILMDKDMEKLKTETNNLLNEVNK